MIQSKHKVYLAVLDGFVAQGTRVFDSREDALRYTGGKRESIVERELVRPSGYRYVKPKPAKKAAK